MKKRHSSSILFLFVLLVANPALAIEDCRDPTPDQRFQMDLCAAHKGCAIDIGLADACASLTRRIKAFFTNKKPELDPGEYKSDRDTPLGPSELEQARKDNELYQQNRYLAERQASAAFNELTVLDRSIKTRIGQYCGTPMDSSCRTAVSEAESLKTRADSYNANKNFVDVRGVLTVESPALAAPYARMHAAFWDEQNKKADEERKRRGEAEEARQKKLDDEARKKDLAGAESNQSGKIFPDGVSNPASAPDAGSVALPRRGGSSGSAMFQQAISQAEQDERDRPAREARERAENTRVAMAAASQTPEDRLRASFDQRIVTTRDRCSAAEGSCQKGCLGVVALGLLSLFSGSSAGASAASDQTQQCSNRCAQTKSGCDEQVAALEQEKSQAISDATQGPVKTATCLANFEGEWVGERTGNRVNMEMRPGGFVVWAVGTPRPGQADGTALFRLSSVGNWALTFPDRKQSLARLESAGRLRVTNPDGWTDAFKALRPIPCTQVSATAQQTDTGFPADGLTGRECLSERALHVNAQGPGSGETTAKEFFNYFKNMHEATNIYPRGVTFPRFSCNIMSGSTNQWRHPDGRIMHVGNCYQDNYRTCLAEARYVQIQAEKTSPPRAAPATSVCFAEVARIERRVSELQQTIKPGDLLSQYRLVITSAEKMIKVLDKCDADAAARSKQTEYRNIRKSADSACQKTASNPMMCGLRFEDL